MEIYGRTFKSVPVENKTSCEDCDIFKMRKPTSPSSFPLCYEFSVPKYRIYNLCQGHSMIWKEI